MGSEGVQDFGESQRRIGALIEQACRDRGATFTGVVYLWGLDTGSPGDESSLARDELVVTGGALGLFKGLVAARASHDVAPRVWMLTRGAQLPPEGAAYGGLMQSPLWGLGRSVRLEEAAMIVRELLDAGAEDQVALRGASRFAPRLVRGSRDAVRADGGLPLGAEGSYLITGGLGSLGRKLADWMVAQGARHLAVTSRRRPDAEAESFLQGIRDRGCNVVLMVADATHEDDVRGLVARLRAELPPLKGIIHSAGMLKDGVLDRMSWEDFTAVTSPKIKGSWLLHEHTRDLDLDFFVLFSSVLSVIGAAGQINYTAGNAFMDALAAHRRAAGLAAAVINWGPWAGTGLATDAGKTGEAIWRRRGTEYLPAEGAMSVFEHLMATGKHQAFVSITRWPLFLRDAAPAPALYAELEKEAAGQLEGAVGKPPDARPLQRRLAEAAPGQRKGVAVDFVAGLVADLLGIDGSVDTRQSLAELGLDSLMAVNLVNRLEDALKKSVPTAS
ncbi:MAG: SDR family NAD(P)-dependent oxidoreductase, partial [Actinobacteria bacterium]